MLMGLGDLPTALAVYCSVAVTVFGVFYGAITWNRSDEPISAKPEPGARHRGRARRNRHHRHRKRR